MDATEAIWNRLDPRAPGLDAAALLIGMDRRTIERAHRVDAVASDDARFVLDSMLRLDRILTSTQRTRSEICVHSVRGPIAWSQTMTARANALGNDDVFVCKTSERSLDTVGNRLVVRCLTMIVDAGSALNADDAVATTLAVAFGPQERELVRNRAEEAEGWSNMAVMARIPHTAPSRRELVRLRGGRRAREFGRFIDFFDRYNSRPDGALLARLADPQTRALHAFVGEALSVIGRHGSIPATWSMTRGTLATGPVSFRHPGRPGPGVPGLSFRGIPLLPPPQLVEGAPWAGELPAHGETITIDRDMIDLLTRMGLTRP